MPSLPFPSTNLSLSFIISISINNSFIHSLMLHTTQQEFYTFYLSFIFLITNLFLFIHYCYYNMSPFLVEYGQNFTLQLQVYDMGIPPLWPLSCIHYWVFPNHGFHFPYLWLISNPNKENPKI